MLRPLESCANHLRQCETVYTDETYVDVLDVPVVICIYKHTYSPVVAVKLWQLTAVQRNLNLLICRVVVVVLLLREWRV